MIFVIIRNKECIGYCTTFEYALENVKKDINVRYNPDDVIVETNRTESAINVYKKYINMNTYPNEINGLESRYCIYTADFLS